MFSRRQVISHSARVSALLAAVGWLPAVSVAQSTGYNVAAFSARTMNEVVRVLLAGPPIESKDVIISGPDIAENGAVVPIGAATQLPGVRRVLLLVEKNPALLAAMFELSDAVEAQVSTRVKMAQSSNVYAVAMLHDGRALFAQKEIVVTIGGCGA